MTGNEFCLKLEEKLAAKTRSKSRIEMAAGEIAAFFAVKAHEVAFFTAAPGGGTFRFRWPKSAAGEAIPIKDMDSFAGRTACNRQGYLDNNFAATRHLHMFEHLLDDRDARLPLQKVMSVPLLHEGKLKGVLQVCRKGTDSSAAGADFTPADLELLSRMAAVIAPFRL